MASNRQIVLIPPESGDAASLGSKSQFLDELALYNIAPDGAADSIGIAYGPGLRVELPMIGDKDPVSQALVTITEEDNAWPVLARLCREKNWRMMDPESGRSFGP